MFLEGILLWSLDRDGRHGELWLGYPCMDSPRAPVCRGRECLLRYVRRSEVHNPRIISGEAVRDRIAINMCECELRSICLRQDDPRLEIELAAEAEMHAGVRLVASRGSFHLNFHEPGRRVRTHFGVRQGYKAIRYHGKEVCVLRANSHPAQRESNLDALEFVHASRWTVR
jgi:hypothetical protein